MAKWEHSKILIYFEDKFDTGDINCLPYLPEEFQVKIAGNNETINIVDPSNDTAGSINLLKKPQLKTYSIDCFFAHPEKPEWAMRKESDKWTPQYWVDFFESAMQKRKVLEMTVTGIGLVEYVTVESFNHSRRGGEELDVYYTIELKQYKFNEIKKEVVNITQNFQTKTGNKTVETTKTDTLTIRANGYFNGLASLSDEFKFERNLKNRTDTQKYKSMTPINYILYATRAYDKIVEKKAYFEWLPVEILSKKESIGLYSAPTKLGQELVNVCYKIKEDLPVDKEIIIDRLAKKMLELWENGDSYKEMFVGKENKNKETPTVPFPTIGLLKADIKIITNRVYDTYMKTINKYLEKDYGNYIKLQYTNYGTYLEALMYDEYVDFMNNDGTSTVYKWKNKETKQQYIVYTFKTMQKFTVPFPDGDKINEKEFEVGTTLYASTSSPKTSFVKDNANNSKFAVRAYEEDE